jgi:thymidylate synthase ThyX
MYNCEILADSLSPQGHRLTTMKITFPRFILAEMNTHRMFSRNSASSRAIPFNKMVKMVEDNPFVPIAWQKDHKGMQGSEYWDKDNSDKMKDEWLIAKNKAVYQARMLHYAEVTKQLCNRLLEPFMWHTVIVTSSEWSNFFELRCPKYIYESRDDYDDIIESLTFKSKKDYIKYFERQGYSANRVYLGDFTGKKRPKKFLSEMTDMDWLLINISQADIHIQAIAELMWDAMNESTPKKLEAGEWHIPLGDNINDGKLAETISPNKALVYSNTNLTELKIKIATARCARISYQTLGDNPKIDYEADIRLHDILAESGHWSPFEHCARVMNYLEHNDFIKGKHSGKLAINHEYLFEDSSKGWCNNFRGFIQYRYLIENN